MKEKLTGKEPDIIEKIMDGKLKNYYQDHVLYDMEYILNYDDAMTVVNLILGLGLYPLIAD